MMELIQDYVSGEFHGGAYDGVSSYMALIVLATLVTGIVLALSTWWRERRSKANLSDDSLDAVKRRLDHVKSVLEPTEQFSSRDLRSWHPITVAVLALVSAAMLWLGWQMVVLPLAAATAVTYIWHFHLRRSGIRRAAVYSLASWIVPYLAVVATIISFPEVLDTESLEPAQIDLFSWDLRTGSNYGTTIETLYEHLAHLQPVQMSIIALSSLAALVASIALAQLRHPLIAPWYVAAASCPIALCIWFINPWTIPLGTFTMVLLGHAMSRERWLRNTPVGMVDSRTDGETARSFSEARGGNARFRPFVVMVALAFFAALMLAIGDAVYSLVTNPLSVFELHQVWYDIIRTAVFWAPLAACGAVGFLVFPKVAAPKQVAPYVASSILVAVLAAAMFEGDWYVRQLSWADLRWPPDLDRYTGIDSWAGPRLIWPSAIGIPLGLSYVIAGVLLLATLWYAARGAVDDYGGLLCGAAWVVVVYWIFELTAGIGFFWGINLTDLLLANLTIAAIAMFALLYWGFGPGSIRTNPRQPRQ